MKKSISPVIETVSEVSEIFKGYSIMKANPLSFVVPRLRQFVGKEQ